MAQFCTTPPQSSSVAKLFARQNIFPPRVLGPVLDSGAAPKPASLLGQGAGSPPITKSTPDGTRTHNLRLRKPTPYPLGHWGYLTFSTTPPLTATRRGGFWLGVGDCALGPRFALYDAQDQPDYRSCSVTVITGDSESLNPGSIPGRT